MTETEVRNRVLVVAPFPPPVHGFAVIMAALADEIEHKVSLGRVDLSADRGGRVATHLAQAGRCLAACLRIARPRNRGAIAAIGVNGGLGQLYTIALAATARLFRRSVILHHHSYFYINRPSRLMATLVRVAGPQAVHVFLSEAMARAFRARYAAPIRQDVLNNALFVPPRPQRPREDGPLRIGLLSNLSREKGLHDFLALARRLHEAGSPVECLLAGPARLDSDRKLIEEAQQRGELLWRGPLYGAQKDDFFDEIDLFVFPTRYEFEAQPTVIYEAFAAGVPVIARQRGTIAEQVRACLSSIPPDEDFTTLAAAQISALATGPADGVQALSDMARAYHATDADEGRATIERLFYTPTGQPPEPHS